MSSPCLLGISGSLRSHSYSTALLRAAQSLSPMACRLELFTLNDVPLYDYDVEAQGDPPAVVDLKEAIQRADAVLIATPEYNHGLPGVLKNALDWASRPVRRSVLRDKPVAIIGLSPGMSGGARALPQLRLTLAAMGALTLTDPEVLVARVHEKFDDDRALTDDLTAEHLERLMTALFEWRDRLRPTARPVP